MRASPLSPSVPGIIARFSALRSTNKRPGPPPQYVPVDTIICFRASIPLVVAVLESAYMGRELPSPRSWAALLGAPRSTPASTCLACNHWTWIMIDLHSASAALQAGGLPGTTALHAQLLSSL